MNTRRTFFWTNAYPALITRAERSRWRPRVSRSRDFRRLCSASTGLFACGLPAPLSLVEGLRCGLDDAFAFDQ